MRLYVHALKRLLPGTRPVKSMIALRCLAEEFTVGSSGNAILKRKANFGKKDSLNVG